MNRIHRVYTELKEIKREGVDYHTFGVVTEIITQNSPTSKDYHSIYLITDESLGVQGSFRLHVFHQPSDAIDRIVVGCVLQLHRLKAKVWDNNVDGEIFKATDVVVFPSPEIGELFITDAKAFLFTDIVSKRVNELREMSKTKTREGQKDVSDTSSLKGKRQASSSKVDQPSSKNQRIKHNLDECSGTNSGILNPICGKNRIVNPSAFKPSKDILPNPLHEAFKNRESTISINSENQPTSSSGPQRIQQQKKQQQNFSDEEQTSIVNWIADSKRFQDLNGKLFWQQISKNLIRHTWQSLKDHFFHTMLPALEGYGLSKDILDCIRAGALQNLDETSSRHSQSKAKPKKLLRYSKFEDEEILDYVSKNTSEATKNEFWKKAKRSGLLPDRTWKSMYSRYEKYLRHTKSSGSSKLDENKNTREKISPHKQSPEYGRGHRVRRGRLGVSEDKEKTKRKSKHDNRFSLEQTEKQSLYEDGDESVQIAEKNQSENISSSETEGNCNKRSDRNELSGGSSDKSHWSDDPISKLLPSRPYLQEEREQVSKNVINPPRSTCASRSVPNIVKEPLRDQVANTTEESDDETFEFLQGLTQLVTDLGIGS